MAHFLRQVPDSALVRGYVMTGADLIAIDQKTFQSVNGDEGGTFSPSSPINIGGAGVIVGGLWTLEDFVNVRTTSTQFITFNKGTVGDYFGIEPGHATGSSPVIRTGFYDFFASDPSPPIKGSVVSWFGGLLPSYPGARFYTPLSVHSGAPQIDNVVINWRVTESHASIPFYLPRVRVIAVDVDGTVIPLRTRDTTTDVDGFQFLPTPVSGAAYYNAGSAQNWTYTCNVVLPVDTSRYAYFVEFIEESGTNSWATTGSQFYFATANHSLVTIFDGRS